ncbi:hypothetical protein [Allorhizocola rhizosphaerae]|uniref:hypothetical protein n=1 Tax=Allorhizocola rhizosphaerae TaxID=1872709 RepID=UPI000E3E0258|nr:hypothetical protein [Allorhizocola rhizosphaerae]
MPAHDDRRYPLPRPDDDPRFCFGLAYDVAKVLAAYGYPPVTSGGDFTHLQQHLFQAIYQQKEETL